MKYGCNMTAAQSIKELEAIKYGLNRHAPEGSVVAIQDRIARDAGIDFAIDVLQDRIVHPRPDWTPCAEGMPEEHEQAYPVYDEQTFAVIDARYEMVSDVCAVTVKNHNGGIFSAADLTVNGKWETYERMEEDHTVVAWQPLPAPYRADDTTGKVKED